MSDFGDADIGKLFGRMPSTVKTALLLMGGPDCAGKYRRERLLGDERYWSACVNRPAFRATVVCRSCVHMTFDVCDTCRETVLAGTIDLLLPDLVIAVPVRLFCTEASDTHEIVAVVDVSPMA